jgi:peptidoglycan/LPS O-acetylase OafA/YrhL
LTLTPALILVYRPMSSATFNPVAPAPEVARAPVATRIDALDWVKGALVVLMVVYHAVNYSRFRPLAFEYLGFLPASFIFITGFVVGQIYAARYNLQSWKPYLRLMTRGLKMLVLFTVLNLAWFMASERSLYHGFWVFAERADAIYLHASGRVAIFEVLLPIAYFLLLAPVLLWLRARVRGAVVVIALLALAACLFLESKGMSFKQPSLLCAGLLGMAAGLVPMVRVEAAARLWMSPLLAFVLYRVSQHFFGGRFAVEMFGAAASVFLLYAIALHLEKVPALWRWIVTTGQYSLLAYLAQIALLQVIVKAAGGKPDTILPVIGIGALTLALTWLVIVATKSIRARSSVADTFYKAIFA